MPPEALAGADPLPVDVAPGGPVAPVRTIAMVGAPVLALPETVLTTEQVAANLDVEADWLDSRTGVRARRVLGLDETLLDLCETAGRGSLVEAGVAPLEVDLVLVATITPDQRCPALSARLAARLGCTRAGTMDIGAACTGYITGLSVATSQIECGRSRTVLLVGADAIWTRLVDPSDRPTAGLFGDGAAATVVRAATAPESPAATGPDAVAGVGPIRLAADGDGAPFIFSGVDTALEMDGHQTFKTAITRISEMAQEVCVDAGVTLADVDLVVCHQANARITAAVGRRLGIDDERVVDCIGEIGNTSGASIPIALALAADDGRLKDGSLVVLAAFGAGFTWGGALLRWGLPRAQDPTTEGPLS